MKWKLSENKCIIVDNQTVCFYEKCIGHEFHISMCLKQFLEFEVIVENIDRVSPMIPLGGRLWLVNGHSLQRDGQWQTFTFDDKMWKTYKKLIHSSLKPFLLNDKDGTAI